MSHRPPKIVAIRAGGIAQAVVVALLGAGAWAALSEGDPASLVVGVPAVAFAVAVSLGAEAPPPVRPVALARFVPFLLGEMLASAWYVASRVLRPRPRLDPGLVIYPLRLRSTSARAFFMNVVTLTPGTLSADLDGERLSVHALDRGSDVVGALAALEARVALIFAEALERA